MKIYPIYAERRRGGFDPIVVLYFFGAASIAGWRLQSRRAASMWGGGFNLGRVLESHRAAVNHELGSRSRAVEREREQRKRVESESREREQRGESRPRVLGKWFTKNFSVNRFPKFC